jgi:hypothetical protein
MRPAEEPAAEVAVDPHRRRFGPVALSTPIRKRHGRARRQPGATPQVGRGEPMPRAEGPAEWAGEGGWLGET